MTTATRSNTPTGLNLRPLQQLQEQGFDLAVLLAMERDSLMRAHRCLSLSGNDITRQKLVEAAVSDLPRDAKLLQAYTETAATLATRPVRELETIADMLANCARSLEASAVRAMARSPEQGMAEQALAHHAIGERLADLLQGAHTLQESGMIATESQARRLESVGTFVQDGPLSKFLDKARALLSQRDNNTDGVAPRPSMA
jgi:hypothetical protein